MSNSDTPENEPTCSKLTVGKEKPIKTNVYEPFKCFGLLPVIPLDFLFD